ncbi:tetratricopeptide repeat protein [bacterium]|nr:tetratricopeptide repeat protein [bacterium]
MILFVCLFLLSGNVFLLRSEDKKQKRDALFAEGIEYANKKMNSQAIEKFKKCILLDNQFVDAYCSLGVVYINEKRYGEALLVLEKAVRIDSRKANVYYLLGKVYEKERKYEEAIKTWEKFISLESDTVRIMEAKKRLDFLSGKTSGKANENTNKK